MTTVISATTFSRQNAVHLQDSIHLIVKYQDRRGAKSMKKKNSRQCLLPNVLLPLIVNHVGQVDRKLQLLSDKYNYGGPIITKNRK